LWKNLKIKKRPKKSKVALGNRQEHLKLEKRAKKKGRSGGGDWGGFYINF